MTITNKERKHIAERLLEISRPYYTGLNPMSLLKRALFGDYPPYLRYSHSEAFNYLAYLIEPEEKICHNFGGEEDTNGENYDFACDTCGFCCDVSEPNYCPNCGCKVIDQDTIIK